MNDNMRKRFEAELERHQNTLEALANERITQFEKEWKRRSRKPLQLLFGMGSCYVEIAGEQWCDWHEGYPDTVRQAIADVEEITDGYKRGCPHDLEIS